MYFISNEINILSLRQKIFYFEGKQYFLSKENNIFFI